MDSMLEQMIKTYVAVLGAIVTAGLIYIALNYGFAYYVLMQWGP